MVQCTVSRRWQTEQEKNRALDALFGDSDRTILVTQQTQLLLLPACTTNGKATPHSYLLQQATTDDQSLHTVSTSPSPSYNFQAHPPSPQLESAEQCQSGSCTPKSSMWIVDCKRTIVLKGMYINLIRDLHHSGVYHRCIIQSIFCCCVPLARPLMWHLFYEDQHQLK